MDMKIENKMEPKEEKCCITSCDKPLDEQFWNERYVKDETGWDLGEVSPPIKNYIDQLTDKNISILIPGCGNTYEAEYLLAKGFTNVTVIDIAPLLVERLKEKFKGNPNINIILGDFFQHEAQYDLILEQTFFCAINPALRKDYVSKMHSLLKPSGKLVGVLFDKEFDKEGPPFGGCKCEYEPLFEKHFSFKTFAPCYNSAQPREGSELFINFQKI
jgi:methyl halide transferase